MPKLLDTPIKAGTLAKQLRESNNIEIIGPGDRSQAITVFDNSRANSLHDRDLLASVGDLASVGEEIWKAAWKDAYEMFNTILNENKDVIPQNIFEVLVLEPKLGSDPVLYGSATDIITQLDGPQRVIEFSKYKKEVDARTDTKIKECNDHYEKQIQITRSKATEEIEEYKKKEPEDKHLKYQEAVATRTEEIIAKFKDEAEKHKQLFLSEAIEDIISYKKLRLTLTALHELFHLIEKKVFVTSQSTKKSSESPALDTEESPTISFKDGRKLKRHIYGFHITVDSQKRSMGVALSETMTTLAEIFYLKKKEYNPDTRYSYQVNLNELKMKALELIKSKYKEQSLDVISEQLKIKHDSYEQLKSVCSAAGLLVQENNTISIPTLIFKHPKLAKLEAEDISLSYRRTARQILELAKEIFADELHKSGNLYATTFRRLLEASTRGKAGLFFKNATFEGLELLEPSARRATLNLYVRFLMSFSGHSSDKDLLLLHAFVRAGGNLTGHEALKVRKDIIDLKRVL
jgi:hypothetical protein